MSKNPSAHNNETPVDPSERWAELDSDSPVPHSGSEHLPKQMRERPTHDFDNTPLEQVANDGVLVAPEDISTLPEQMPTVAHQPEKTGLADRWSNLDAKQKAGLILAVPALLFGISKIAGGETDAEHDSNQTTHEQSDSLDNQDINQNEQNNRDELPESLVYESEVTNPELLRDHYDTYSSRATELLKEEITRESSERLDYTERNTTGYWRGAVIYEIELRDGQTGYVRFENPVQMILYEDQLHWVAVEAFGGNVSSKPYTARVGSVHNRTEETIDIAAPTPGQLFAFLNDQHSGQLVPGEKILSLDQNGIAIQDMIERRLRGETRIRHSTARIFTSWEEATQGLDVDNPLPHFLNEPRASRDLDEHNQRVNDEDNQD